MSFCAAIAKFREVELPPFDPNSAEGREDKTARLGNGRRKRKEMVGPNGLEPSTSSVSRKRSNQTELRAYSEPFQQLTKLPLTSEDGNHP